MAPKKVRLIVSPSNIKFQAPFPHNQKRQLSLLNISGKRVVYRIELDEESLFSVCPPSGCVDAFDTVELTIVMKPTESEKDAICLSLQYLSNKNGLEDCTEQAWQQAPISEVHITLENYMESEKELMRIFGGGGTDSKSMVKAIEEQYKPMCNKCCRKRMRKPLKRSTWLQRLLWSLLVLLLSLAGEYGTGYITIYIYISSYNATVYAGSKYFAVREEINSEVEAH